MSNNSLIIENMDLSHIHIPVLKNPLLHCVSWSSAHTPNCKETGGGSTGLHVFVKIANFFHWTYSAVQCSERPNITFNRGQSMVASEVGATFL